MNLNIESEEDYEAYEAKYHLAKNELAAQPVIKSFAQGYEPINPFTMEWRREGGDYPMETHNTLIVTPGYDDVLGLEKMEGRFFDADQDKFRQKKVVINEAAKRYWGISDIGESEIKNDSWGVCKVIGVLKDFNYQHLSSSI